MDHIPTHKIDRSKTLEQAARLKDISDRAKAASPIVVHHNVLDTPAPGGSFAETCIRASRAARDRLLG